MRVSFAADLWEHSGDGSWHFVSLPADLSEELRERAGPRRGFGSVRVKATVGATTWRTSVFPSKELCYVLPVRQGVRTAERIAAGDTVRVVLDVDD